MTGASGVWRARSSLRHLRRTGTSDSRRAFPANYSFGSAARPTRPSFYCATATVSRRRRPDDILDALIGVPVSPARLLAIVSGCVTTSDQVDHAVRHDGLLEVVTADGTVYLTSAGSGWQPRAGRFGASPGAGEVLVDYGPFVSGLPRDIRITSTSAGKAAVSLNLRVQAVQTNVDLDPALFRVTIPDGATTISLEELRQIGPLAEDAPSR